MEFYNFNTDAYNEVVKIFGFRFYKQIKNTGIVFNEILSANNLATNNNFYLLICNDQEEFHYVRFKELETLLIKLTEIAKKRLNKLKRLESTLMEVNNTEAYEENKYYNDTEMSALGISSIEELLSHFENKIKSMKN